MPTSKETSKEKTPSTFEEQVLARAKADKLEQEALESFRSQFGVGREAQEKIGVKKGERVDYFSNPIVNILADILPGLGEIAEQFGGVDERYAPLAQLKQKQSIVDEWFFRTKAAEIAADQERAREVPDAERLLGGRTLQGMSPLARSIVESQGNVPLSMQPVHSDPLLGPTKPLFKQDPVLGKVDTSGVPPELLESSMGQSPLAESLMTDFGKSVFDVENLMEEPEVTARRLDPGLQAPQAMLPDEDAPLSDAAVLQAGKELDTRLRTPRATEKLVSTGQQKNIIAAAILSSGGTVDQAQAIMQLFDTPLESSVFNSAMQQIGRGVGSTLQQAHELRQLQEREKFKQERLSQMLDRKDQLANANNQFRHGSAVVLAEMEQQYQLGRDETGFGRALVMEEIKSNNRIDASLESIKARNAFTKEQNEVKRSAQIVDMLFKRQTAFDLEHLKHLNAIARDQAKGTLDQESSMIGFYRDLARKDPELAQIIVDQMSQAPEGTVDPLTSRAVVEGIRERVNDYIIASSLQEDIQDIQANKFKKYPDSADKLNAMDSLLLKYPISDYPSAKSMIEMAKQQVVANEEMLGKVKGSLVNVQMGTAGERKEVRDALKMVNKVQAIRTLLDPSLTGQIQGSPLYRSARQFIGGIIPFAQLSPESQAFISMTQEVTSGQRKDLLGVQMTDAERRLSQGAFISLDMPDEQFAIALDVMERNQRDIADYTSADIVQDEAEKKRIKNRIVARAEYFGLRYKGTEAQKTEFLRKTITRLKQQGMSKEQVARELEELGVEMDGGN